jgi:hypothetical protein
MSPEWSIVMTGRPCTFAGTVDNALSLEIGDFVRAAAFDDRPSGKHEWRDDASGLIWAQIFFTVTDDQHGHEAIVLSYQCRGEQVSEHIEIDRTRPYFGGHRRWFKCPIMRDGDMCGARARILYLPPGGLHFGCSACHSLTYLSCRESHKFYRLASSGRSERDDDGYTAALARCRRMRK